MGTETGQNDRKAGEATTHVNITQFHSSQTPQKYTTFLYSKANIFYSNLKPYKCKQCDKQKFEKIIVLAWGD